MKITTLCVIMGIMATPDCSESADSQQREHTEKAMLEANSQVGMPAIKNFHERRLAKTIYELRDDANLQTWTYLVSIDGQRHLLCRSMGYGLPYSVQYSNPQRQVFEGSSVILPQAEPNGLFMPASADATWVLCVDPKGQPKPVYVEPRVVVSPFPLHEGQP